MTAPSCEALLEGVPPENDNKWSAEHVLAARRALVRGDVEGSQRAYCQALRARENDATAAVELAQVLLLRRDATAAARWAEQAARLEPSSARVLALLGDTAVRTGDLDGARAAWLKSAKLTAEDGPGIERMVESTLEAAERSLKERDPARAERLLRRAVVFQPENGPAHANMALVLTQLGFAESAALWSKRAAELATGGTARARDGESQ